MASELWNDLEIHLSCFPISKCICHKMEYVAIVHFFRSFPRPKPCLTIVPGKTIGKPLMLMVHLWKTFNRKTIEKQSIAMMPWRRKNISITLFWKNTILEVFFIISSTFNNLLCHLAICIWQFNVALYHFMTRFSSTFDGLLWHLAFDIGIEKKCSCVRGGCKPLKSHQHNQLTTLKLENPEGKGDDDGDNYNNKKLQQWQ